MWDLGLHLLAQALCLLHDTVSALWQPHVHGRAEAGQVGHRQLHARIAQPAVHLLNSN